MLTYAVETPSLSMRSRYLFHLLPVTWIVSEEEAYFATGEASNGNNHFYFLYFYNLEN